MIRLSINWDFISPLLQVISGTLIIEDVNVPDHDVLLIHCKIKKENGSITYTAIDGIEMSAKIWNVLEPQVQSMINGYFAGMTLKSDQYNWVHDSADISLKDWKEKKGIVDDTDVIFIRHQSKNR